MSMESTFSFGDTAPPVRGLQLDDGVGRARPRLDRPLLLLVDDNPKNLLAFEGVLRRDDVEIVSAESGQAALELLLEREVSVAIVDVQMPGMDGFELAKLMRGVGKTRRVPIIFVTAGSETPAWIDEAYRSGAADFLFKPIDPAVLKSKVDVFVALDKQRRALQRSEQRFRSLVEASSQVVWCADATGLAVEGSPSWRAFTGQRHAEFIGCGWLDAIHPDDRAPTEARWHYAVSRREPVEIECRLRRPDGSYTWTSARCAPVFDERGALVEWVMTHSDISARKANERLRELFVGILGHDLRNPLGAMMTAAQVVLGRSRDPRIADPVGRVLTSGNRALRMVEQLLDMTRIRLGGGVALATTSVDLRELAADAISELDGGDGRVALDVQGDSAGEWDADRMLQVLSNLIGNATQHGAGGGAVTVTIDGRAPDRVTLRVHNDGPAIPADLRASLFEPFRGTRARGGGLGLGLFITSELVSAHGGRLGLTSDDASGTTFTVELPRCAVDRAGAAPGPEAGGGAVRGSSSEEESEGGMNVVVVDDSEDNADMFAELLRIDGHSVRTAGSAAEALALLGQEVPDIAFLDIGLPDQDGYQLAAAIRERFGAGLHLVALTGFSGAESRDRAKQAGFNAFVVKPFSKEDIDKVMRSLAH